jgi:hypothetical protein
MQLHQSSVWSTWAKDSVFGDDFLMQIFDQSNQGVDMREMALHLVTLMKKGWGKERIIGSQEVSFISLDEPCNLFSNINK